MEKDFKSKEKIFDFYAYDKQNKKWISHQTKGESANLQLETLKIVTYNIYFGEYFQGERYREILHLIKEIDADIICLQEVIPAFVSILCKDEHFQKFFISDCTGSSVSPYGVMIISKHPIRKASFWSIPSDMGRSLLLSEFSINEEMFSIGTVHLESLSTSKTRAAQLEVISKLLEHKTHVLLVGDFNFDSDKNYEGNGPLENDILGKIMPKYSDLWVSLCPSQKGYTYDSVVNKMIRQYERMRYDRMMLKRVEKGTSNARSWQPQTITLLGDQPCKSFPTGGKIVFPSDHFGVKSSFNLS